MKSSKLHLSKHRRSFVRLIGEIQRALLEALDEEHRSRGITRAEIARLIGRNKSFVTRKLNGESNMTLQTLAELAFALDRPIKIKLPSRVAASGSNRVMPQAITSEVPQAAKPSPVFSTSADGISAMAA
jgi:transcriptional regulator with XRE-family HTH domain